MIILIIGGLQGGIRKELDSYDSFFHNFKQSEVKPLPLFYILAAIELIFYCSSNMFIYFITILNAYNLQQTWDKD